MDASFRRHEIGQRRCFCTNVVILATIAVSRVAERAKKLEEEQNKGILSLGASRLKD